MIRKKPRLGRLHEYSVMVHIFTLKLSTLEWLEENCTSDWGYIYSKDVHFHVRVYFSSTTDVNRFIKKIDGTL
jgi:hypothetical protein